MVSVAAGKLFVAATVALVWTGVLGGVANASDQGAAGTTGSFYVDALHGSDTNSGASPRRPWRTLARAERQSYQGGDRLLLHGDEHFRGTLRLTPANLRATSYNHRLTITSYGGGVATITPVRGADGIDLKNVAGVRITGVDLAGPGGYLAGPKSGVNCNKTAEGVDFEAAHLNGYLSSGLTVDHSDVSGFCDGINVASDDDASGIRNVVIRYVDSHDNADAGITTDSGGIYNLNLNPWLETRIGDVHLKVRNVLVDHVVVHNDESQGGIVLWAVDGVRVTNSLAYHNSLRSGGGVGIWTYIADHAYVGYNEAWGNGSCTLTDDGDGFDFDMATSDSVMEHNYAHDNGGIGFLVEPGGHNETLRYNRSVNDGCSGQDSLYVIGGNTGDPSTYQAQRNVRIYGNDIESSLGKGPLVDIDTQLLHDRVRVFNNRFVTHGPKPLLYVDHGGSKAVTFRDNSWQADPGDFAVQWDSHTFRSFAAWHQATRES